MPKRMAGKSGTGAKSRKKAQTVEEYFAGVPGPAQRRLREMRTAIRSVVPANAREVISYGIPAFKGKKVLVWYAAFAEHCSLFPTSSVIEKFKHDLTGFKVSKGTIQFPLDKSLPVALIKKIAKERVAESGG